MTHNSGNPDRVSVICGTGHATARYSGYTVKEVMYRLTNSNLPGQIYAG
jgi:hypothetical protein